MKAMIIHASDIHFKATDNSFFNKVDKFSAAFINQTLDFDEIYLLLTGDIAYSGKSDEYLQAMQFIDDLSKKLHTHSGKQLKVLLVPGNHDCDFSISGGKVRDNLIDAVLKHGIEAVDKEVTSTCCNVQKEWCEFEKTYLPTGGILYNDNLLKVISFSLTGYSIIFYCYNTSWISRPKEEPGFMHFPFRYHDTSIFKHKADLIISMLHHPFNWQQHTIQRDFKSHIEKTSDIVITGHEHIPTKSLKDDFEGNYTEFIEGAVLQDTENPQNSGFNLILIDIPHQAQRIHEYKWNGEIYECKNPEANWISYKRYRSINKRVFEINQEYESYLRDPGATFTHPHKQDLVLEDFFIFPNVIDLKAERTRDEKDYDNVLNANILCNIDPDSNLTLVVGEEKAGKTTLCKFLYRHYYSNEYIPVFIDGRVIKSDEISDFDKQVEAAFSNQYSATLTEKFTQLENGRKLIVIDDFDSTHLSCKYRTNLLSAISKRYVNVIITGNDLFQISGVAISDVQSNELMAKFKQFQILEFGHLARSKLVYKWVALGREKNISEEELVRNHDISKQIVDTIIGSNFVPSYPLFILTILQSIEAGRPHDLKESTYGHYYGFLIGHSLAKLNLSHDDFDAYYSYITELTYYVYRNKLQDISEQTIREFHTTHCSEYKITLHYSDMLKNLLKAEILEERQKVYRIKYRYVYYFFVAKYLANNISQDPIKEEIARLCRNLHIESIANIVLFLTHHTKDPYVLDQLLSNAKLIFSHVEPVKFGNDIAELNKLLTELPKLVVNENVNIHQNREQTYRAEDELAYEATDNKETGDKNGNKGDISELDFASKLNFAFKNIEIIGQVLKNYYGSLKGIPKYDLGEQAYLIGLRAIKFIYSLISEDTDGLVREIGRFIEDKKLVEKDKIEQMARRIVFQLFEFIAFSFIKKTGRSVGSDKLADIFSEIVGKNDTVAVRLIDVSIKLDYYRGFPFEEIRTLVEKLKSNLLPLYLMKRLVVHYLYMFPTDYKERQKICSLLGISVKAQRAIEIKSTQKKQK